MKSCYIFLSMIIFISSSCSLQGMMQETDSQELELLLDAPQKASKIKKLPTSRRVWQIHAGPIVMRPVCSGDLEPFTAMLRGNKAKAQKLMHGLMHSILLGKQVPFVVVDQSYQNRVIGLCGFRHYRKETATADLLCHVISEKDKPLLDVALGVVLKHGFNDLHLRTVTISLPSSRTQQILTLRKMGFLEQQQPLKINSNHALCDLKHLWLRPEHFLFNQGKLTVSKMVVECCYPELILLLQQQELQSHRVTQQARVAQPEASSTFRDFLRSLCFCRG